MGPPCPAQSHQAQNWALQRKEKMPHTAFAYHLPHVGPGSGRPQGGQPPWWTGPTLGRQVPCSPHTKTRPSCLPPALARMPGLPRLLPRLWALSIQIRFLGAAVGKTSANCGGMIQFGIFHPSECACANPYRIAPNDI